jgi:uncharacterized oligopeptide transporter (OPT) family protein
MKKLLLLVFVIAVYVLHQDVWNFKKAEPLLFGVLPIGLAYHAAYSILCAIMMAILVKTAWPKHLEIEEADSKSEIRNPKAQ